MKSELDKLKLVKSVLQDVDTKNIPDSWLAKDIHASCNEAMIHIQMAIASMERAEG